MSNDVIVSVEGVSKKYCTSLKRSLKYGLKDLVNEILGKTDSYGQLRKDEFWGLRDVDFELKRGEALGIIGVNGSGKTTLLNLLYGLLKPSTGTITIRGRIAAMIQLGAGFNPVLTGRENIYINAAVLGMSRRETQQKIDEIIAFADLDHFIDAPVQNYSKGMKMRLGFSVATNIIEPDLLLIDEILATGDIAFRSKCQQRINEIVAGGAGLVLVSHSNRQVEVLCPKTLFLHKGIVKAYGPTMEVIPEYMAFVNMQTLEAKKEKEKENPAKTQKSKFWEHANPELFQVSKVELLNAAKEPADQFQMLEPLVMRLHFVAHQPIKGLIVRLTFATIENNTWISSFMTTEQDRPDWSGTGYVDCVVPELLLREGVYIVHAACAQKSENGTSQILFKCEGATEFSVIPDRKAYAETGMAGLVYMPSSWSFGTVSDALVAPTTVEAM